MMEKITDCRRIGIFVLMCLCALLLPRISQAEWVDFGITFLDHGTDTDNPCQYDYSNKILTIRAKSGTSCELPSSTAMNPLWVDSVRNEITAFHVDAGTEEVKLGEKAEKLFNNCSTCTDWSGLSKLKPTANTKSLYGMFSSAKFLSDSDLSLISDWNVSNVTNMEQMFYLCKTLTKLSSLSSWDVTSVTNMSIMFGCCEKLSNIDNLSSWNVSNVTNMKHMFYQCKELTSLGNPGNQSGLSSWDVSAVTNMSLMFYDCESLNDISALSSWDVSAVTNMEGMFEKCKALNDISALSSWTPSAMSSDSATIASMFSKCDNLIKVDLSGWADSINSN